MTRAAGILFLALLATACTKNNRDAAAEARADSIANQIRPGAGALEPVLTDTLQPIYVAHGIKTGPFWTVTIFGEGIRYRWADNRKGVVFTAGRVDGADSMSTWTAKRSGEGPRSIQLEILRLNCTDGATDSVYKYRAALMIDGREQRIGCAKAGPAAPPLQQPGTAPAAPRPAAPAPARKP